MSRTDTLYARLDELEKEYSLRVRSEFQSKAKGYPSRYLWRKMSHFKEGKYWLDSETGEIEKLEKEVVRLREKLGLPLDESCVALVYEFAERQEALKDKFDGGVKPLIKEMLERLDALHAKKK